MRRKDTSSFNTQTLVITTVRAFQLTLYFSHTWLKKFVGFCYMTYGLDSAHNFTYSRLSGYAFFKICRAYIELLIDRSHVEMV